MKKRIISALIAALVLTTSITGCGILSTANKLFKGDIAGVFDDAASAIEDIDAKKVVDSAENLTDAADEKFGEFKDAAEEAENAEDTTTFETVEFVRAKDGDTIVVTDKNGEDITVRLIGINTPESVSSDDEKNCKEGEEASEFLKNILSEGETLYLEYDEDKTDTYGRTLAYVWLSNDVDTSDLSDFMTYNLGAIIMQNTYCESVYYSPNGKYRDWYDKLDSLFQTDTAWRDR